jgi:phosphoesterase RecJ-like protein
MIADGELQAGYDAVVVLDGDRHRLMPGVGRLFCDAAVRGIVDHHASTRPDGYTHCWIEPHATSTCEMIYDAMQQWKEPLDPELATLLYVGAIFDTGGFRYSNTTPATHRMAAALLETGFDHASVCTRVLLERRRSGLRVSGQVFSDATFHLDGLLAIGLVSQDLASRLSLVPGDLEGLVEGLLFTAGVEVAILLIERDANRVKVSLRSRGRVNVGAGAQQLSPAGGGHAKASGASVDLSLAATERRVIEAVRASL